MTPSPETPGFIPYIGPRVQDPAETGRGFLERMSARRA
jgi:hypothetical protein